MTKLQTCNPSSASPKLGIGRESHMISKSKPKIRIIHIYAPEIIKTDAASFRELVQRLTGKPEDHQGRGNNKRKSKTAATNRDPVDLRPKKAMALEEDEQEFLNLQNETRVKNEHEEEEVEDGTWRRSKSNEKLSGFLDGFSELDGFIEELTAMPLVDQN